MGGLHDSIGYLRRCVVKRPDKDAGLKFPRSGKKPKVSKKGKLTAAKVQPIFNAAIRRRDGGCVMIHSDHRGNLEASHFFAVGSNSALRFYPPNVHCQCSKHHVAEYHNDNPMPYVDWMQENVTQFVWMERNRKKSIRYTQEVLQKIRMLSETDNLSELQTYIEELINGN